MKHLFKNQQISYLLLLIAMCYAGTIQSQFIRSYEFKNADTGTPFRSSGRALAKMHGGYLAGGYSHNNGNMPEAPMLLHLNEDGSFRTGLLLNIPKGEIVKIRKIESNTSPGYVVVGNTTATESRNSNIFLVRTDTLGVPLRNGKLRTWKSYGDTKVDKVTDMLTFTNSKGEPSILMVGRMKTNSLQNSKGAIYAMDQFGKIRNSILLTHGGLNPNLSSITRSKDGHFFLSGVSGGDLIIYKIDEDLRIIREKTYQLSENGIKRGNYLMHKSVVKEDHVTGELIVFGSLQARNYSNNYQDINFRVVMFKIDHKGNSIWARDYGIKCDEGSDFYFEDFKLNYEGDDAKYVIQCTRQDFSNLIFESALLKIDENGNHDWSYSYKIPQLNSARGGNLVVDNQSYVATGDFFSRQVPMSTHPFLIKTNLDGSVSLAENSDKCEYNQLIIDRTNYFILDNFYPSLSTNFNPDKKTHLLIYDKIEIDDLHGCYKKDKTRYKGSRNAIECTTCDGKTYMNQNYPNPIAGEGESVIVYELPEEATNATIQVTDLQGRIIKVFNKLSKKGSVSLQTSDLKKGLYQYSLVIDGTVIETKKMLVEK